MAPTALNMPSPNKNLVSFSSDAVLPPCSSVRVTLMKMNEIFSARLSVPASVVAPEVASEQALHAPFTSLGQTRTSSCLARCWRDVMGLNRWKNLVEPLDPLLREEVIRYGHFVAACYKAFDLNPSSKRFLNCKFGKRNILKEVGLGDSGYTVTKYIYATPDINIPIQNSECCGRWIGYVAVSSDDEVKRIGRRDVLITFRGTVTNLEWMTNLMSSLTTARLDPHNPRTDVKVESGFLSLYTSDESDIKFGLGSCREQLLSEVSRILNKYKGKEEMSITLAGHSMGSSLALLLAYDIAELGLNKDHMERDIQITVFSFGGPRVGNSGFKERCEELGVKVLRIVNANDPITKIPGVIFNENFRVLGGRYEFPWSCLCYAHVGVELVLDFFMMQNPSCVHDLETYISLLRCSKTLQAQTKGIDFLNIAKDWFFTAQNFNTIPWINAAIDMMNLVQSQRT